MSERSDDRRYPLRRLFGVGPVNAVEPCLRCRKPETTRVILVLGDAGFHIGVLASTGMDMALAKELVVDRWTGPVKEMFESAHRIVSEAGHPEWAPLPKTPQELVDRQVPLQWRICRGCAEKSDPPLATMSAKRLKAILEDEDGSIQIPHVIIQKGALDR